MSHIRVNSLEGHYTIKRLKKLPKRGNANWLYTLEKDHMSVFYFWTLNNNYEKVDLADSISAESTSIQAGTNITITGTGTSTDPYIIDSLPVPVYTLDIDANSIRLLSDGTVVSTVDLSLYLDDTNLARLVNGTLDSNTGIATFTRDDSSTFDVDFNGLLGSNITNTSQLINDGEDGTNPFITDQDIPQYTLDINANLVRLLSDGNVINTVDLSLYLDDTNLARLVSGTLNGTTGIATFTRDDSSTFDVDFSSLIDEITIDNAFSSTSTNALENQVIRNELFVLEAVSSQRPVTHAQRIGIGFNANFRIEDVNIDRVSADNISFDRNIIVSNVGGVNYIFMDKSNFDGGLDYLENNILDNSGNIIKFTLVSYLPDILLNYRDYGVRSELIFENTLVSSSVNGTIPVGYEAFILVEGSNLNINFDVPAPVDTRNTAIVLKTSNSTPIAPIDIQEGNWTPELVDKFTAGVTYGGNFIGTYYKIGKMVTATFTGLSLTTSGTPSNTFAIRGLPFAPNGNTNPINIYQFRASAPTPDWDEIFGNVQVSSGITEILFIIKQANNGLPETSSLQLGGVVFNGSNKTIQLSVTYTTDE